jgi:predicted TIM-barrel fold metal-dependent hydrolase
MFEIDANDSLQPRPAGRSDPAPASADGQTFRVRLTRRTLLAGAAAALAAGAAKTLPAYEITSAPPDDAIWDAHTHLSGISGTIQERVDQLLEYADRVAIGRIVLFMGTSFSRDPSPEELRSENNDVLAAIEHAPDRVLGMVYLNPKHRQACLDELNRCVRDGPMIGIKLWIAIRCNEPELDPIVRRAVELQVPILQHAYDRVTENLPGESSCADVAALAARHPDASFICAHTGNDWERGIRMIRASKNVWAEVSGSDPTAGFVEMAVRELGPERVVFGSDAGGRSFASQLAKVHSADLPEEASRLILGGNLRRLLHDALARKGVAR